MTRTSRLLAAAAAAAALLGGAFLAARSLAASQEADLRLLQQRLGEQVAAQARDALAARLAGLQGRADAASSLPELRAQVGRVDWNTLKDGFLSEPWWAPVRAEATIYGISMEGPNLDSIIGVAGAFGAPAVIERARAQRRASAFGLAQGYPVLVAAAVIEKPNLRVPAVLLLARPLDDALLKEVAARVKGALVLSDGKARLSGEGAPNLLQALEALVGQEDSPPDAHPPLAQVAQLGPGLWLWTHAPPPAGDAGGSNLGLAIWAVAGLLAAAALALGLRGPAPAPAPAAPRPRSPAPAAGDATQLEDAPGGPAAAQRTAPPVAASNPGRTPVPGSNPGPGPAGQAPVSDVTAPAGPNQFGRYTLLDRLGEGGMAEVFTAVAHGAEGFKRTFVVKRLRGALAGRKDVVNMFIDEARLASSFVHSNIIPVFDFGKVGEEYFMATEYILGRDLGRVARRAVEVDGQGLAPLLVVHVLRETLRALEYAHQKTDDEGTPLGIVHRDISPNNILVSARGEVKLFDFGIAKAEGRLTETQAGTVKGNYRYMSAEQAYGNPVDQRSDLASLGLSMYFALTGDSLYEGSTQFELIVKAARGAEEHELAKVEKHVPVHLRPILLRAIAADPARRYQSAGEFLAALAQVPSADGAALAKEMHRLFGDDLRAEQARLQLSAKGGGGTPDGRRAPRSAQ